MAAASPIFERFTSEGRCALAALQAAGDAATRLAHAAAGNEPLSNALKTLIAQDMAMLRNVQLEAPPLLDEALALPSMRTARTAHVPDVVLIVLDSEIKYGFVPHVGLNEADQLTLQVDALTHPE
jgi:hypothetical protein